MKIRTRQVSLDMLSFEQGAFRVYVATEGQKQNSGDDQQFAKHDPARAIVHPGAVHKPFNEGRRMTILDIDQGSPEWVRARLGKVTASGLGQLVDTKFDRRTGEMPFTYLCCRVAEAYRGSPLAEEAFTSRATEEGQMLEDEARRAFCFAFDQEKIRNVGFVLHDDGRFGCSPDALLGDDSGVEIKCPYTKTHVSYLLKGKLPNEYAAQVHGNMYATGRKSWRFFSYSRTLPPFTLLVKRDEAIMDKIAAALAEFYKNFDKAMETLRARYVLHRTSNSVAGAVSEWPLPLGSESESREELPARRTLCRAGRDRQRAPADHGRARASRMVLDPDEA
jgi:hypothetical protein